MPKKAVEVDQKLSRLQNFVPDAAKPLIAAHNELTTQDVPDPGQVLKNIQLSLRFLGNTTAQFSQEWRSKALAYLNPDLKSLAKDKEFPTPPFLFGPGFEKKANERSETVEFLRKAASSWKNGNGKPRYFWSSHSQWGTGRGSGYFNCYSRGQYKYSQKNASEAREGRSDSHNNEVQPKHASKK